MSRNKKIVIAIDGFSSCGKSTLAKQLAKELHYIFIDSGAMYRGITYFALQNELIQNGTIDQQAIVKSLDQVELSFALNQETKTPELYLNGTNISKEIRSPEVASYVSKVATIKDVREKMVADQRKMGANGGIVMDGRDIASVVFPDAALKLFITADVDERVKRRYNELTQNGISITKAEVKANLIERDEMDSSREESPLIQVHDAIVIDNTNLSKSEQLQLAVSLVKKKQDSHSD